MVCFFLVITMTVMTTAAAIDMTTTSVVMTPAVFIVTLVTLLLLLVASAVVMSGWHSSDINDAMTIEHVLSTVMNSAPIEIAVLVDTQSVKWDTSTDTEVVGASLISARKVLHPLILESIEIPLNQ